MYRYHPVHQKGQWKYWLSHCLLLLMQLSWFMLRTFLNFDIMSWGPGMLKHILQICNLALACQAKSVYQMLKASWELVAFQAFDMFFAEFLYVITILACECFWFSCITVITNGPNGINNFGNWQHSIDQLYDYVK